MSAWYDFLPVLIVAGMGMGCTFAPMTTVALHDVEPRMAGAASGMLNTTRQVGAVIGTAAVGALLQNQLSAALASQARQRSAGLPPQVQQKLVSGFSHAAGVGAGQGGGFKPPAGLPAQLVHQIEEIAHAVFTNGYVTAMRATMVLPIVVLAVGALSCLAIRRTTPAPAEPAETQTQKAPTPA
jgi:hypothetical protein